MNKQGLITLLMMEKISAEVRRRGSNYTKGYEKGIDLAIKLIEASGEESLKPLIPQFVAEWIEKVGNKLFGLNYDSVPSEIYDWVYGEEGNLKKLHLACAIGYEVEREKRYLVKIKLGSFGELRKHHTRKELEEAGFGEVFNSPLFEVEEVE